MASKIKNVAFFMFCFSLGLGFFYAVSENVAVRRDAARDPAALYGKVFQITNLTAAQIKEHLQKKIKVTPTISGQKTISFSGFSSALCKTYSAIEIEFWAEGVAVGGEAPIMKINTPCEAAQDPAEIAAINLPIDKILNEKSRNAEYNFDGFKATISFANSADEWPRQWVLKRVEFKNTAGGLHKAVDFNRAPASANDEPADAPIVLEF